MSGTFQAETTHSFDSETLRYVQNQVFAFSGRAQESYISFDKLDMQYCYGSSDYPQIYASNAAQFDLEDSLISNSVTFYMSNSTDDFEAKITELTKLSVGAPVRTSHRSYFSPAM